MANALPAGIYPQDFGPPQAAPNAYGPPVGGPAPVAEGSAWVLAGGVVAVGALLGWVAVVNAREHEDLREDIFGVDRRLLDYQQAHAIVHAALVQRLAAAEGALAAATPALASPAAFSAPSTVYAEPVLAAAPAYSLPAARPGTVYSFAAPVSSAAPTVTYVPVSDRQTVALPMAPVSASAAPTLRLPPQLEAAVAASLSGPRSVRGSVAGSGRGSSKDSARSSRAATLRGV